MRAVLLALLFALPVCALDVSGRWSGVITAPEGEQSVYLIVYQRGNALRGTGGASAQEQTVLTNGAIQGNHASFDVVPPNAAPLHFEVTVDDDTMKGTVKAWRKGQFSIFKVTLRKRTT